MKPKPLNISSFSYFWDIVNLFELSHSYEFILEIASKISSGLEDKWKTSNLIDKIDNLKYKRKHVHVNRLRKKFKL